MIFNSNDRQFKAMKARSLSLRQTHFNRAKTMSGLIKVPSWLKAGFSAVAGLMKAIGGTITTLTHLLKDTLSKTFESYIETLKEIGRTVNLVALVAMGRVPLSQVFASLGKVFRQIGNTFAIISPLRLTYNFLKEAPLTADAFNELDKFTGGMITNVVNVSDLPWRAMRGDAISKQELIKDVITIIQVVTIVFAGPAGVGFFIGNLIGREVCKNQTKAQDLCRASFAILGMATGQWLASDLTYLNVLERTGEDYLVKEGVDQATIKIVRACQDAKLMGRNECKYVAQALVDYIQVGSDKDFSVFLVDELKRVATQELVDAVRDLYPSNHPIRRNIEIKYQDIVVKAPQAKTAMFLLLAGGATLFLLGAS